MIEKKEGQNKNRALQLYHVMCFIMHNDNIALQMYLFLICFNIMHDYQT